MDLMEAYLLLHVMPSVYPWVGRASRSRYASYFPLFLLILNVVIFVFNTTYTLNMADEDMVGARIHRASMHRRHHHVKMVEEELEEAYDEEDHDDSMLRVLDEIEQSRSRSRWAKFIGTQPRLRDGVLLVSKENNDEVEDEDFFHQAVVLITKYGGSSTTYGYVINDMLPEDESRRARDMLHEFSADLEDEEDAQEMQEEANSGRQSIIGNAIQNRNRLWLGNGGPVRDQMESWVHIHNCTDIPGAYYLQKNVAVGGDLIALLSNDMCFVKLLYGSARWSPGQLENEISNGVWSLVESSDQLVFNKAFGKRQLHDKLKN